MNTLTTIIPSKKLLDFELTYCQVTFKASRRNNQFSETPFIEFKQVGQPETTAIRIDLVDLKRIVAIADANLS